MAQVGETKGIILFSRDYKEKDKLIKIFTESAGKVMFFAKGIHRANNPCKQRFSLLLKRYLSGI